VPALALPEQELDRVPVLELLIDLLAAGLELPIVRVVEPERAIGLAVAGLVKPTVLVAVELELLIDLVAAELELAIVLAAERGLLIVRVAAERAIVLVAAVAASALAIDKFPGVPVAKGTTRSAVEVVG